MSSGSPLRFDHGEGVRTIADETGNIFAGEWKEGHDGWRVYLEGRVKFDTLEVRPAYLSEDVEKKRARA